MFSADIISYKPSLHSGCSEIMPFGTTKEVVPKSACRRIRPFGPRRVRFENTWRVSESMIFGTPTTLQRIAASMLVQKHVYLVPLAANLSARRSNAIEAYAFSRRQGFGKSSLARRLFCVQAYCPQSKALLRGL